MLGEALEHDRRLGLHGLWTTPPSRRLLLWGFCHLPRPFSPSAPHPLPFHIPGRKDTIFRGRNGSEILERTREHCSSFYFSQLTRWQTTILSGPIWTEAHTGSPHLPHFLGFAIRPRSYRSLRRVHGPLLLIPSMVPRIFVGQLVECT